MRLQMRAHTSSLELNEDLRGLCQALGVDLGVHAPHDHGCVVATPQANHLHKHNEYQCMDIQGIYCEAFNQMQRGKAVQ